MSKAVELAKGYLSGDAAATGATTAGNEKSIPMQFTRQYRDERLEVQVTKGLL